MPEGVHAVLGGRLEVARAPLSGRDHASGGQGALPVAHVEALFREAWITGVRKHFPGEPKPGYITPWEDTPDWERQAAGAVHDQVRQFLDLSDRHASRLTREQKSRFVATCWTAQMYRHFEDPKPGYVADWPDLPDWQKETDADNFEAIEDASK